MIPKIAHFYWGRNKPLSFFRSLTVRTFALLNPDWQLKLWVPKVTSLESEWTTGEQPNHYDGDCYLDDLGNLSNVQLLEFDFDKICIPSTLPEVHKSDLLRWYLLGVEQGLWSDMDIIYTQPMSNVIDCFKDAGLCRYDAIPGDTRLYQAIGFLTSEGFWGHGFFYALFVNGMRKLKSMDTAYQAYGALLLDEFLEKWKGEPVTYIDPHRVYLHRTYKSIKRYWEPGTLKRRPETIGFHWYGGNPVSAKCEALITPDNILAKANEHAICKEISDLWK